MTRSKAVVKPNARVLVARGVDGLLVGWLAVIVWVAVYTVHRFAPSFSLPGLTLVYWTGAVLTAAHFGLSYHLAYRGGMPAVRTRPLALGIAPALLFAALTAFTLISLASGTGLTQRSISFLITSVYLLTTWHYIKQAYGVARVGAAYAGIKLTKTEADVLRYGLYPLWFLGAAQVLVANASYHLAGFRVGFALLPAGSLHVLRVLALIAAIPIAVVMVSVARRQHRLPPSGLLAPYAAAFLWLGLPTNAVLTLLLLAPFHALQYLAVGHRAELAIAEDEVEKDMRWWLNIFVGAACGGLLLSRWVPNLLDAHAHRAGGPLLFAAAFFVFLNLHHYLIDASIWRSSGELLKAMSRSPRPAAPISAPSSEPAASRAPFSVTSG